MRFCSKGTWIWFQYMHESASQISPLIWRCLFSYLFTMLTIPFNSFVKHNFVCFFIRYRLGTLKIGCSWRCALYFLNICSTSRSFITYPNRISLSVGFKYMIHMHAYLHTHTQAHVKLLSLYPALCKQLSNEKSNNFCVFDWWCTIHVVWKGLCVCI